MASFPYLKPTSKGRTDSSERRGADRYAASLKVRILTRERETICFSRTVGVGGMFIRTDRPWNLNQIVRMRVALPDREDELELLGVVRWRRRPEEAAGDGVHPGMGVAFYSMDEEIQALWVETVGALKDCLRFDGVEFREELRAISISSPIRPPATPSVDGRSGEGRRASGRLSVGIKVSWTWQGRIFQQVTDDISVGGLFVPGICSVPAGEKIDLTLFHTANLEAFRVRALVARVQDGLDGKRKGLAVTFTRILDGTTEAFREFVTPDQVELSFNTDLHQTPTPDEPPVRAQAAPRVPVAVAAQRPMAPSNHSPPPAASRFGPPDLHQRDGGLPALPPLPALPAAPALTGLPRLPAEARTHSEASALRRTDSSVEQALDAAFTKGLDVA